MSPYKSVSGRVFLFVANIDSINDPWYTPDMGETHEIEKYAKNGTNDGAWEAYRRLPNQLVNLAVRAAQATDNGDRRGVENAGRGIERLTKAAGAIGEQLGIEFHPPGQ